MKSRSSKNVLALLVILGSFGLVEWIWVQKLSILGLFGVSLISCLALAWVLRPAQGEPWPLPQVPASFPLIEESLFPSRARLFLSALGLFFTGAAFLMARKDSYGWTLAAILAAASCWRPLIDVRQKTLSKIWLGVLGLVVIGAAACFRLYQAGEVPQGLIHWDESLVYAISRAIVQGKREIFNMDGADGQWPYWFNAATLKIFGDSIYGYRMSPILSGIAVVGMMIGLGRELGGPRLGLASAAFMALGYWAVGFSRAEYLVMSSYIPVLACLWLLLLGLRKGSAFSLAMAGFSFGWSFSIYNGGKILPIFLFILCAALWYQQKDWRMPLRWALIPFAGGTIIALAPILLWAFHDPRGAHAAYFGKMDVDWIVGADVIAATSSFERLKILTGRIIPNFWKIPPMFSTSGNVNGYYYFLQGQTLVDRATLLLLITGMAACIARFRKPVYALLFCWWFVAFIPALVATPQYYPLPRRIMMNLPATMLLSALGFLTLADLLTDSLKTALRDRLVLAGGLLFFGFYAAQNWETYFTVINKDLRYLEATQANYVNGIRAIGEENAKSPVYLVNFRKTNQDDWLSPFSYRSYESHNAFLAAIPQASCQANLNYFTAGGLFGALEQIPPAFKDNIARDPLVVLTPFHYYLEPMLLKELGGERVQEIFPAESNTGTSWTDFGFAPHEGSMYRFIRIRGFNRAKLQPLKERWLYPSSFETLTPPPGLANRETLRQKPYDSPEVLAAHKNYDDQTQNWRAQPFASYAVADPYYWIVTNLLTMATDLPLRMKAEWILDLPQDGLYAFGASSPFHTILKVDGKKVFSFTPRNSEELRETMNGYLGEPQFFKAGRHQLKLENVILTFNPIASQAIRLVWQKPGGAKETLPLEVLLPRNFEKAGRGH